MRKHLILCVVLVSVLVVRPAAAVEEEPTLTSGQMVVLNLIIHGVVNLYSTTNLIAESPKCMC